MDSPNGRCERHKSGSSSIAGLANDRWRAGPVTATATIRSAPTATHQWIYIYRSLQHARLRRRQNRTVYAVLNRKQNLRSTYCSGTKHARPLCDSRATCLQFVSKKEATWCLIITLANVDRFSKFFHQVIREKILSSTTPAICCYTTLWKSKIQKCYWFWVDSILNKLLPCSWRHFEHLIYHLTVVRQTVSRLLTLSDWLTFWSLSDDISTATVART